VARTYIDRRSSPADRDRLSQEVRKLMAWLGDSSPEALTAEYAAPIDVVETAAAIEIVADIPGVARDAVRIVCTQGAVVITGRKAAPVCEHREAAFHFAERTFGFFARVIRLTAAVDATRARAALCAGELHISLPRVEERRGRDIPIAIESV